MNEDLLTIEELASLEDLSTSTIRPVLAATPDNGSTSTDNFGSTAERNLSALASSATAYYEVRWHDLVHLTTTRTRAYTNWTWNGSCVTSSSNWGDYWWLQATGWYLVSNNGFFSQSCNNVKSTVDWAHYQNPLFCNQLGGSIVNTYVDDAWVRGYFNGTIGGGITYGTWTTEVGGIPATCPNLHYHTQLVKQP